MEKPPPRQQQMALTELSQRAAREWVSRLAAERKTTPTGLARRAGLNPSTVTRPMSAGDHKHLITRQTIERIASTWQVAAPESLLKGLPEGRNRTTRAKIVATLGTLALPPPGPNDVPVWGAVATARAGFFHLNRVPLDYTRRPPGAAAIANLACLRMPDESMEPWRRTGEPLFLDPHRPIGIDHHALVEVGLEADPNAHPMAFVGQLRREGWYQHGPRKLVDLRGLRVLERFRILEWQELLP